MIIKSFRSPAAHVQSCPTTYARDSVEYKHKVAGHALSASPGQLRRGCGADPSTPLRASRREGMKTPPLQRLRWHAISLLSKLDLMSLVTWRRAGDNFLLLHACCGWLRVF